MELGGGAAPDPLQVSLHHGVGSVGVREVLVLRDGGQVLREINIDSLSQKYLQSKEILLSAEEAEYTRCCMTVRKSIGAVL